MLTAEEVRFYFSLKMVQISLIPKLVHPASSDEMNKHKYNKRVICLLVHMFVFLLSFFHLAILTGKLHTCLSIMFSWKKNFFLIKKKFFLFMCESGMNICSL